jgi:uncharacterized membrane protein YcaP (DUF421 family)
MDLVLRATVVYLLILVVTRAVGRRELGQLGPADLILLVVIGDMVQQGVTQNDQSMTGTTIVISTLAVLTVAGGWLSFRFRRLRPLLEGDPIVLISEGEIQERALRRQRISDSELASEARLASIGSLSEVRFAILESSGRISFITHAAGD